MNLQEKYNNLLERMKKSENLEKYNALNLNPSTSEEFTKIYKCCNEIRKYIENLKKLENEENFPPFQEDGFKRKVTKKIVELETLLNQYNWK